MKALIILPVACFSIPMRRAIVKGTIQCLLFAAVLTGCAGVEKYNHNINDKVSNSLKKRASLSNGYLTVKTENLDNFFNSLCFPCC